MSELIDTGRAVDIVTLANELARYKEIESVGGVAYLASLTEGLPRRPVIEDYIRIVKDKSMLRRLMGICSAAIASAADQSEDAIGVLDATESQLLEVSEAGLTQGLQPLDVIVRDSFGTIDNLYKQSRDVTGLATHFYRVRPHDQRPAKGRTDHHCGAALDGQDGAGHQHRAERGGAIGKVVAVFSLEMNKESLLRRMLAVAGARRPAQDCKPASLGREDQERLQAALGLLVDSRIFIDDSAGSTIAEMRAKARRLKQNSGGLDLIMVDYLQLMSATLPGAGRKGYENRMQEVSAISRGLKAMAKELNVPVVALSQLSRNSERRDDKRPMLSDLRESGSIEQDADVVAFIHRESYYNRDEEMSRVRQGQIGDHHRQAAQRPHRHGADALQSRASRALTVSTRRTKSSELLGMSGFDASLRPLPSVAIFVQVP